MILHGSKGIYNVDSIKSSYLRMSSKLFSATSIKFFGQQVLIVAHVDVGMNLSGRQQVWNNLKKYKSLNASPKMKSVWEKNEYSLGWWDKVYLHPNRTKLQ
jgi:hypothetical protein